jgi:hypothetical protein
MIKPLAVASPVDTLAVPFETAGVLFKVLATTVEQVLFEASERVTFAGIVAPPRTRFPALSSTTTLGWVESAVSASPEVEGSTAPSALAAKESVKAFPCVIVTA